MSSDYHKLNDDMTTSEVTLVDYAKDAEKTSSRISYTVLPHSFTVSTIFLRIDHAFPGGPPILFETMVFNKKKLKHMIELDSDRYHTYEQAITGHNEMVNNWLKKLDEEDVGEILKKHEWNREVEGT